MSGFWEACTTPLLFVFTILLPQHHQGHTVVKCLTAIPDSIGRWGGHPTWILLVCDSTYFMRGLRNNLRIVACVNSECCHILAAVPQLSSNPGRVEPIMQAPPPSMAENAIHFQLPTNSRNKNSSKSQVNFLGNENLSPKSNEPNNKYIRPEIQYPTPGVFLPSFFISVVWLSRFMAKLRNIFCTSEWWTVSYVMKHETICLKQKKVQWKPWSACCSCSRFPSILVPCCAEMPDLMEKQGVGSTSRSLPTKIWTKKTKKNWCLVGPGWEGMRWNAGTNCNDTQMKVDEPSFPTRHQPKKTAEVWTRPCSISMHINMMYVCVSDVYFWAPRHLLIHAPCLETPEHHMDPYGEYKATNNEMTKPCETLPTRWELQQDSAASSVFRRDHSSKVHGLSRFNHCKTCLPCDIATFLENPPGELNFIPKPTSSAHFKVNFNFIQPNFLYTLQFEPRVFRLIRSSARLSTSQRCLHLKSRLPWTKLWESLSGSGFQSLSFNMPMICKQKKSWQTKWKKTECVGWLIGL